jgi:general stress protein YciG
MGSESRVTDAALRAALRRGREADLGEPRARSAGYDAETGRVVLELTNGCAFAFPAEHGQGLRGATPEQLARVQLEAGGRALRWDELDVDLGVAPLVAGIFGTEAWMRELRREMARAGGRASSEAKAKAARENGRKGGRPPRKPAGAPSADAAGGREPAQRRRKVA